VLPNTPGSRFGLKTNDLLTAVNGVPVRRLSDLERVLHHTGAYGSAHYSITRDGFVLDNPVLVIPEPVDRSAQQAQRVIGSSTLPSESMSCSGAGRRCGHALLHLLPGVVRVYALKVTGSWTADWTVFWCNVLSEALQPALFLHFALSFPEERLRKLRRQWLLPLIYGPGAGYLFLWIWAINRWQATELLKHRMDQMGTAYDAAYYVLAATLFLRSYASANTPLLRQQLKWLTRGTLLAVLPFTLLYAIPYLFDLHTPALLTRVAGFSLVFLPLTFSWAIVRYRLMDTDLIFKRGVAYSLATGLILGGYFGVIALTGMLAHNRLPESVRDWGEGFAIVLVAAFFEPLKRRIQGWVDVIFDRHRYDYRKALVEFGRGLSSETDIDQLLDSIVERLPRTLLVSRVAVFLAGPQGLLRLAAGHGLPGDLQAAKDGRGPSVLNLNFLDFDRMKDHSHIFMENALQALHLPEEERRTAALLDLNYYLPCRVQDGAATRTIAVIGLGRTIGGDFLSSEDVELLESLASYIGIALQNASLYSQLEAKISEFERLKEFNENIVESINVGILAIDLEDRIESWNATIEVM
jgi:hypothetical protein